MATRAAGNEPHLSVLDSVLGLNTLPIQIVIQLGGMPVRLSTTWRGFPVRRALRGSETFLHFAPSIHFLLNDPLSGTGLPELVSYDLAKIMKLEQAPSGNLKRFLAVSVHKGLVREKELGMVHNAFFFFFSFLSKVDVTRFDFSVDYLTRTSMVLDERYL